MFSSESGKELFQAVAGPLLRGEGLTDRVFSQWLNQHFSGMVFKLVKTIMICVRKEDVKEVLLRTVRQALST